MRYSFSISLALVAVFFAFCSVESANYFGKYIGPLKSYHHGLQGDVYVVDSRTLHIRNFNYDGEGPAGYFYVSNTKAPNDAGIKLRDERGSTGPLKKYRKKHITLTLPEGKTINNFKWFYVWCDEFSVNFGDVKIPKNLDYPKPQKIGKLAGVHSVSSDNIVVVDAQTLLIPAFSYDGEAPDAKFWVGSGSKPNPQGIRVPDENGKEEPLRKYEKKTIVLTLPGDITVFDIGYFGIWCEAFTVDFGHVEFPKDLNVPPSLKMLGVSPQQVTPSILSYFHLESPYSLYSELPDSEVNSTSEHKSLNLNYHSIQIRDTSVSVNNSNNSSVSDVGYVYHAKNISLFGDNNSSAYNCTDVDNETYSNSSLNDTKVDRENIEINTTYDVKPIKIVDNTTFNESNPELIQNYTTASYYYTLIKFIDNNTSVGNMSKSAEKVSKNVDKFQFSTSNARQKLENNTENLIEVIKSVSTEYESLIENNFYGPLNSNKNTVTYGPWRNNNPNEYVRNSNPNTGSYTNRNNKNKSNKNRNNVYCKEDTLPVDNDVIDDLTVSTFSSKSSQNGNSYPRRSSSSSSQNRHNYSERFRSATSTSSRYNNLEKQPVSPIVSKIIDIETENGNNYRERGYDSSINTVETGAILKPSNQIENYRTIASSLTVGKIRGDNFRAASSFTAEKIRNDGFKVTTASAVEKFRNNEFKSSSNLLGRNRHLSEENKETPKRNVRPNRGGKRYRSTEKPQESRSILLDNDKKEVKVDDSKSTNSVSSDQLLAVEDVMFLNSLDSEGMLSYDVPTWEE